MKTKGIIFLVALSFLMSGTVNAFDDDRVQDKAPQQIGTVMKRGVVGLLTFPSVIVTTAREEKELYPKYWPATYVPRLFMNSAVQITSSFNDIFILPWYVWMTDDTRSISSFYDLPDEGLHVKPRTSPA